MIRIQFPHPATLVSAFQHPCRTIFAAALVVAGPLFLVNQANAALNCTAQPSCSELGYSQLLDKNCISYLKCPFDKSYQICIKSRPEVQCPDGYSKDKQSAADCGSRGQQGWTFESTTISNGEGLEICGKCTAKTCPEGSSTTAKFCTIDEPLITTGYTGETACTKCNVVTCPENYAVSASKCGMMGVQGWTINTSTFDPTIRPDGCYKCVAKTCPIGYEAGRFCLATQTTETSGYSGDMSCNKCVGSGTLPPITVTCSSLNCKYDCSNLGGPKCSNSPTYGPDKNAFCLMCNDEAIEIIK